MRFKKIERLFQKKNALLKLYLEEMEDDNKFILFMDSFFCGMTLTPEIFKLIDLSKLS